MNLRNSLLLPTFLLFLCPQALACPSLVSTFMQEVLEGNALFSLYDVRWNEEMSIEKQAHFLKTLPPSRDPIIISAEGGPDPLGERNYIFSLSQLFPLCSTFPAQHGQVRSARYSRTVAYPYQNILPDSVQAIIDPTLASIADLHGTLPVFYALEQRGERRYRITRRYEDSVISGVKVTRIEYTHDIAFPDSEERRLQMWNELHPSPHLIDLYLRAHSL